MVMVNERLFVSFIHLKKAMNDTHGHGQYGCPASLFIDTLIRDTGACKLAGDNGNNRGANREGVRIGSWTPS